MSGFREKLELARRQRDAEYPQVLDRSLRSTARRWCDSSPLKDSLPDGFALHQMFEDLDDPSSAVFNLKGGEKLKAFDKLLLYYAQHKALREMGLPGISYTHLDTLLESLDSGKRQKYQTTSIKYYEILKDIASQHKLLT